MKHRGPTRALVLAALLAVVTLGPASAASAEPGDADGAWGRCGYAYTSEFWDGFALNTSDRLVPAGAGREIHVFIDHDGHPAATRLLPTGWVDPTYGTNGTVTVDALRADANLAAHAAFVSPTGRLYVVGWPDASNGVHVAAIDPDGQLDETFGDGGIANLSGTRLWGATVQNDGRFVAITQGATLDALRLDGDGVRDPTFAMPSEFMGIWTYGTFITSDPWNRLVVASSSVNGTRIQRFDQNGLIDPSFDATLTVPVGTVAEYRVTHLDAHADGSLDAAFQRTYLPDLNVGQYRRSAAVVAFTSAATPDPQFGNAGWVTVDESPDSVTAEDTARLADGSIVIAGTGGSDDQQRSSVFVTIRTRTGAPRTDFPTAARRNIANQNGVFGLATGLLPSDRYVDVGASARGGWGVSAVTRIRRDALEPGAGLILQWNGETWPTRYGSRGGPPCAFDGPHWEDTDSARGIAAIAGHGGYVVDSHGAISRFSLGVARSKPPRARGAASWPAWDIARGIASKADGSGGYTLDGFGGVHPFHTGTKPDPAPVVNGPYWRGWDITRGIALLPDGNRGYILDGFGGIHPFSTPGHAMPPSLNHTAYWRGWDIARGIGVLPDGTGGYILDAFGGVHPFGVGTHSPPPLPGAGAPYAAGEDWVRGFTFVAPMPASSGISGSNSQPRAEGATSAPLPDPARREPTPRGPVTHVR